MKKIYLLLAATFISAPVLSHQVFAANDHKPVDHPAATSDKPSGTVYMTFHSADVGVGYTWGDGILKYHGKTYKFKIKGGNVVALGFSKSQASGHVYNLKNIYDFAGNYASAAGEATAGVGVGAANLKNTKNVVIAIDTKTMGGRLAGAPGGFSIKFVDSKLQRAAEANDKAESKSAKQKKQGHTTTEDLNQQQLNKVKD
ncbi:hypothetical protein [Commensalibacter oyaizuii]|uniref:Uncharacterized protein n=1 Tax=Commensalibacter oyaizuii TaxID=3043873 RepID=A0ABT6PYW1_9PROT|nr:hypothetical protein [Commensalibacter sp. TBRC 16381]MDI2090043.1 hypothetical protein [Commensalibacter sp. TBRC 16381]